MDRTVRVVSREGAIKPGAIGRIMAGFPHWKQHMLAGRDAGSPGDAVLRGRADVGVYPANALVHPLPEGLAVAALTVEPGAAAAGPGCAPGHPLEGCLVAVVRQERPGLRTVLAAADIRRKYGMVSLVGGLTEDLLSPRADSALLAADIIFYDDLVDGGLPGKYRAEKVYVGKRMGRPSARQEEINRMMYEAARTGRRVVRLKCGDPLIFSRGGEEMRFLRERLVEVEVVPGISSAQVAAAAAGIPLTHRGVSSRLEFLAGRGVGGADRGTMVYFMAASRLGCIASKLQRGGREPKTPAAVIRNAGRSDERIIVSTLDGLAGISIESPVILAVGEVVRYCRPPERLAWFGVGNSACRLNRPVVRLPPGAGRRLTFGRGGFTGLVFDRATAVREYLRINRIISPSALVYAVGSSAARELLARGYPVFIRA